MSALQRSCLVLTLWAFGGMGLWMAKPTPLEAQVQTQAQISQQETRFTTEAAGLQVLPLQVLPLQVLPLQLLPLQIETDSTEQVTPRGAFIRSLIVPGWGHLSVGAPTRAAFYVSAQGASTWMLAKSWLRQRSAERFLDFERDLVIAELRRSGITGADSLRLLADQDPRVTARDELVSIRGDQVEDWVALALFLTLLGATDALVAAHLSTVPEPLSFGFVTSSPAGGISLGFRVPIAGRR
jgi:hypothetical protein